MGAQRREATAADVLDDVLAAGGPPVPAARAGAAFAHVHRFAPGRPVPAPRILHRFAGTLAGMELRTVTEADRARIRARKEPCEVTWVDDAGKTHRCCGHHLGAWSHGCPCPSWIDLRPPGTGGGAPTGSSYHTFVARQKAECAAICRPCGS